MISLFNKTLHRVRNPIQTLRNGLYRMLITTGRFGEKTFGPRFLSWFILPLSALEFLRRLPDYAYFKRLRRTLPVTFWRSGSLSHYFTMLHCWMEALAVTFVYDRLHTPPWKNRMSVTGAPPPSLPEWGHRPVIVTFLHSGGFPLLRYWLRAQGIPAATVIRGIPRIAMYHGEEIRRQGDALHDLSDVAHFFYVERSSLRPLLRFLRPGHILSIALDGNRKADQFTRCDVHEGSLYLSDGAVRLAQMSNAILLSASVRRMAPCRYEFHFGQPVPDALLQAEDRQGALQHLAGELWHDLEEEPTAMTWRPLEALAPALVQKRVLGP